MPPDQEESKTSLSFSLKEIFGFITILVVIGIAWGTQQSKLGRLEKEIAKLSADETLNQSIKAAKDEVAKAADSYLDRINKMGPPGFKELLVLDPTWVREKQQIPLFSDEVMLTVGYTYSVTSEIGSTSFQLDIPPEQTVNLDNIKPGERKTFTYRDLTYIIEVISIRSPPEDLNNGEAYIKILRRL